MPFVYVLSTAAFSTVSTAAVRSYEEIVNAENIYHLVVYGKFASHALTCCDSFPFIWRRMLAFCEG